MQEGLVFHDTDGDGHRTGREKGLARVAVSDGRTVVLTDVRGRWMLPEGGPRHPFVIAPRGWRIVPSAQEDLCALERWTTSSTPSVHVGGLVDHAPPPDARVGWGDALAPLPMTASPGTLPTAFNVGDLHVIVVDDRDDPDDARMFVEADLFHAGAARPVLLIATAGHAGLIELLADREHQVALDRGGVEPAAAVLDRQGALTWVPLEHEGDAS